MLMNANVLSLSSGLSATEMTKTQTRNELNISYGDADSGETFDIYRPSRGELV